MMHGAQGTCPGGTRRKLHTACGHAKPLHESHALPPRGVRCAAAARAAALVAVAITAHVVCAACAATGRSP